MEGLEKRIYEFRKEHTTDEQVHELESQRDRAERTLLEMEREERKKEKRFKEDSYRRERQILKLKKIKQEVANAQPNSDENVPERLLRQREELLELAKKGLAAKNPKEQFKFMVRVRKMLNYILTTEEEIVIEEDEFDIKERRKKELHRLGHIVRDKFHLDRD